jgi:DMSO/TMAO reductase YedYZ molybdopterin-dependent catalytic subunit
MAGDVLSSAPKEATLQPEVLTTEPYNSHTPREALCEPLTPVGEFFVRNHFSMPRLDIHTWRLRLRGAVETPFDVGYDELLALPSTEVDIVLECAGNGRSLMAPRPPGLPWKERAVGCARFAGVPFRDVVARSGVNAEAIEFLFVGADSGQAYEGQVSFERSLPLAKALHPQTLLATHMNGVPLTLEHGAPVRLVVPGWYGIASVKWLTEAHALTKPFTGLFQADQYVYCDSRGIADGPVTEIRVKSLVVDPPPGAVIPHDHPVLVCGWAWSGETPIERVDISDDDGATWRAATLAAVVGPFGWREWLFSWVPPGPGLYRLMTRATDASGNTQPLQPPWNALGYGNNAVAPIEVVAR